MNLNPWGNYRRYEEGFVPTPENIDAQLKRDYDNLVILSKTIYDTADASQSAELAKLLDFEPYNVNRYFATVTFRGAPKKSSYGNYPPNNIIGF